MSKYSIKIFDSLCSRPNIDTNFVLSILILDSFSNNVCLNLEIDFGLKCFNFMFSGFISERDDFAISAPILLYYLIKTDKFI